MKPVHWIGSSKRDLLDFPQEVVQQMGFCLSIAQEGGKALNAVPLIGFGGAGVIEVIVDNNGDTYRSVYTVNFSDSVYVLHAFKKKSKSKRETPQHQMALVRRRLRVAQNDHEKRKQDREKKNASA